MPTYEPIESLAAVTAEPQERWAIGHVASHVRLWAVAVLGLAADLWTKNWAFNHLGPHESRVLIPHLASLQLSLNPGALFGLGAGLAPIFVGASALALMFVLYLFAHSTTSRKSMHVALGLVLAGAIGNLYDRTTQSAYVANYNDRGRVIGTLVEANERFVTIGDFPTGTNPRRIERPSDPRSGMQPVVRDFIKIEAQIGTHTLWPWIFNIADALLVVGVAVLLINFWFDRKHAPLPGEPPAQPA
jgi:lipoprotein signal peptidase